MSEQSEAHAAGGPAHALERMIFFSDAVFAIAITLLVIEIHVPEVHEPSDRAFLLALAGMVPNFIGFFVSFYVIGAFWGGHHRAFACARNWHSRLMMPNLMLLSAIAALPFFTAFSSEFWGQRVPVAAYCAWLLLTALLNLRLVRIVLAPPVVDESIAPAHARMIRRRAFSVVLGTATAFVLSLFVPWLGQPMLMTIPLWRLWFERRGR